MIICHNYEEGVYDMSAYMVMSERGDEGQNYDHTDSGGEWRRMVVMRILCIILDTMMCILADVCMYICNIVNINEKVIILL